MDHERAVAALYQAPLGEFVETRKRLAAEVKAAGDKDGAKQLLKRGRPPISAWAVNQLYWHARDAFDAFMATAARLREGDLGASGAHREALGRLRQRAAAIIGDAGHNANEAVLRRTTMTLSAIAAIGSFAPDPPGALAEDRDPPGFEAVTGLEVVATKPAAAKPEPVKPAANSLEAILAASVGKSAAAPAARAAGSADAAATAAAAATATAAAAATASAAAAASASDADADADAADADDDVDADADDVDATDEELEALAELQQASVRDPDARVEKPSVRAADTKNRADIAPPSADKIADLMRAVASTKAEPPPVEAKRPRHLASVPMPDDDSDDEARIAASRQRAADAAEREERERIARVRQDAAERAEREERERIANEKTEKAKARERERLEKAIAIARKSHEARQREVDAARHQLALAEGRANDANDELAELEQALVKL